METKEICPNCWNSPEGGQYNNGIVFPIERVTENKFFGKVYKRETVITCTHCLTEYILESQNY